MANRIDQLTPEQRNRIERFLAAYNAIDAELRDRINVETWMPLSEVIESYARKNQYWQDERELRTFSKLRNFVVHSTTKAHEQLAVPTEDVVQDIEQIHTRLFERVIPRFSRKVTTIQPRQSLADVLRIIDKTDFSQIPVYDGDQFVALLTENGITRWLAHHLKTEMSLVDMAEVSVDTILEEEENRKNVLFASRRTSVDRVASRFGQSPFLEAVILTETGKRYQKPLGIVTRWDIIDFLI